MNLSTLLPSSLICALLTGCTAATPPPASDPLKEAQQKALEDAKIETEVGRNMAGRLLRLYGTYPDEALSRYVNEVGLYVARFAETPERRYMFEVYNSETVNAFACPGGYILISSGALRTASSEAELGHILGHEIIHVSHQHMFKKLKNMNQAELDKAAAAASESREQQSDSDRIRKRPSAEESPLGATLARYISGQAAGLNAIKAAKAGLNLILEEGLGPQLEHEADRQGTKLAILAGYDPIALTSFLCRMETQRGRPKDYCLKGGATPALDAKASSVLDKTHPQTPERVKVIQELLHELKADQMVGAKGKQRYLAKKQNLKPLVTPVP